MWFSARLSGYDCRGALGRLPEVGAGLEGRRGQAERSGDKLGGEGGSLQNWMFLAWLLRSEIAAGGTRPGGPALLGN